MSIFPPLDKPLTAGAGFKPEHLLAILQDTSCVGFFEVHAENYMGAGGAPHAALQRLCQDYPLFLHGVSMSIGGEEPLDPLHLARFKDLVSRYAPHTVSEHLAWSSHDTAFYNDLLPAPYTEEVQSRVADHINELQDAIGRTILLENPSTYVAFVSSTMSEADFLRGVVKKTGCGLLLDVNNVHVSATNHGYSASRYLSDFPLEAVGEIHLAGHATEQDDDGRPLLIDTHDREVANEVWRIFEQVIATTGPIPTLIEWDADVPAWPVLKSEAEKADAIIARQNSKGLRRAS